MALNIFAFFFLHQLIIDLQYNDGVCDSYLNSDMCCYDGGDCPNGVVYENLPTQCNLDSCDHVKFGDGICDKYDEDICCMDQYDCVYTKQVWDNLTVKNIYQTN